MNDKSKEKPFPSEESAVPIPVSFESTGRVLGPNDCHNQREIEELIKKIKDESKRMEKERKG